MSSYEVRMFANKMRITAKIKIIKRRPMILFQKICIVDYSSHYFAISSNCTRLFRIYT